MSHKKILCPECQHTRTKNRHDRPVYVDTTTGAAKCYHCNWTGRVDSGGRAVDGRDTGFRPRRFRKPDYQPAVNENEKLLQWFAARGIDAETVRRNRIEARNAWMPQVDGDMRVLCFPYFVGGEVVNVKYRSVSTDPAKDKKFKMEADAELVLYGIDGVDPSLPLIITEGEIDKLSFEAAGFMNVVSVPNGTGTNLEILAKYEELFSEFPSFVVAGDSDEPGLKFQAEIIRRLGAEKCWRVSYPDGCKDANDVLRLYGAEAIADVMDYARPVPIEGVYQASDVMIDILDLYRNGRPKGEHCGFDNLAKLYRPRLGTWTVVTGSPNSGKSSLVRALTVNLAISAGWKFVVFPPEDCPPAEYFSHLIELYVGLPFDQGPTPRMDEGQVLEAIDWVNDRFIVMNPNESRRSQEDLLKLTKTCILRHGVNAVVIDPFNRLEHFQPPGMTMEQYQCGLLGKFDAFVKQYSLHGFYVAHPTKLKKDASGVYPVATMYDVSGSSHWFNMPDFGLSIYRHKDNPQAPVEVHVQKVRHRWCGELGMAEIYYDRLTGRYGEYAGVFGTGRTLEEVER
jgi:twinkle protein